MNFKQLCTIHGTLTFSKLEEEIIRHPSFNRLADLKQLGYAYKGAYKGATHSRLAHTLGTCHLARNILEVAISKNRESKTLLEDESFPSERELNELVKFKELLGACALLHDINHSPFAHTIQDHLDLSGEIIQSDDRFLANVDKFGSCELFNEEMRERVKDVFVDSRRGNFKFGKLFFEIIRGPLGASTIDFTARDHFESGFGRLDLIRLYENFILVKKDEGIELALDLRDNNNPLTTSYYILFNRFKLSQRVYFHKTCASAEAMIGKALRRIKQNHSFDNSKPDLKSFLLKNDTDPRFMISLEDNEDDLVSYLGRRLQERQIFDVAFSLELSPDDKFRSFLCQNYRGVDNIEKCTNLEMAIADKFNLQLKDIAVFCYSSSMYGFEMKSINVLDKRLNIRPFNELPRDSYIEWDAINLLKKLHQYLWKFYIFCGHQVNGKKDNRLLSDISIFCESIFKGKTSLNQFLLSSRLIEKMDDLLEQKETNDQSIFSNVNPGTIKNWMDLISEYKIYAVIKEMKVHFRNDREISKRITQLSSQLERIKTELNSGILLEEQRKVEINRITSVLIDMIQEMEIDQ